MTFSILHSSARPGKWREVYEAWMAGADYPATVEYILVVDGRWGFKSSTVSGWANERPGNKIMWNTRRRCYADGVNLAAESAAGGVLIVNADDQYPAPHWDTVIEKAIKEQAGQESRFVVWVNTGTPREIKRKIMPMPVVSLDRYHSLGYVLYPGYESMYADNDFCEMALKDELAWECKVVRLDPSHLFPHRHPYFDRSLEMDEAYAAQNRQEAYNAGAELLKLRRENGFKEVKIENGTGTGLSKVPVPLSTLPRRRIALCLPGEWFPAAWVSRLIEILALRTHHDIIPILATSSNVYHVRYELARQALEVQPPVDYVAWLDDDQLLAQQQVMQAVLDLECVSSAALVAGWTLTGDGKELSCGRLAPDFARSSLCLDGLLGGGNEDLKEVDYTGFPFVMMRRELLARLGPDGFNPYPVTRRVEWGIVGEDISFCIRAREAGFRMFIDRRIMLPHLKMRDITAGLLIPAHNAATASATVGKQQNDLPRESREINQPVAAAV